MADIEMVIKIPESRYRLLQKQASTNFGREKLDEFAEAVLNGTPLPKHGRLIDADALTEKAPEIQEYLDVLADTIIEADKVESEEQI